MIGSVFNLVVYQPLYNALVFLIGAIPSHDVGIAVILLTIVVRIVLYPLSRRAVDSQLAVKKLAPEIEAIKKKYKGDAAEQSKATLALYKERGVHPFAGALVGIIQIPILLGLYWVFARGGLPHIDPNLLYPFVHPSNGVNMEFLGFVDMGASRNIVLALLVGISQFAYMRLSMGPRGSQSAAEAIESSFSSDMAKSFDLQMRYVFPVTFAVIAYFVVAAAPLYWLTANAAMIAQEYFSGRRF